VVLPVFGVNETLSAFTALASGDWHTCALTAGGGVKCWGSNSNGQLGDGSTAARSIPVDVIGLSNGVRALTAGSYHTCALMSGGTVKCWGSNSDGQLGDGSTTSRSTPVDVAGLGGNVIALAAGAYHTCALTAGGGVKCWGQNEVGQLGDGTTTQRTTPVDVIGMGSGVVALASASGFHTCALTTGGGAKCWGHNYGGQLGDGTTAQRNTPVDVIGLGSGVIALSAGGFHTCALIAGGEAKCWGENYYGQLGNGTNTWHYTPVSVSGLGSGVVALVAGYSDTCAVTASGSAKCWGFNDSGQIGDGTTTTHNAPTDVSGLGSGVAAIAPGGDHTCALTASGGVKCWGSNSDGQIGNGAILMRSIPMDVHELGNNAIVVAGYFHTCAVTASDGAKCWGYNDYGQIGDGTTTNRSIPVDVSGLTTNIVSLVAGGFHSCALTTGGDAKCWGDNYCGELGDGTTTAHSAPVDVSGLGTGVTTLAAGGSHTCALTAGGGIKCWGSNRYGQLGDGTTTNRNLAVEVVGLGSDVAALATGQDHTCALTTGGGVKCWGRNYGGMLGDGTTIDRSTPVDVTGLNSGITAIAVGGTHTCALTTARTVKCWGNNDAGQLGDGTTTNRSIPVDVNGLGSDIVAVAAGGAHTCALTASGAVKCWGWNDQGQLGDSTTENRSTPVVVSGLESGVTSLTTLGYYHTCATVAGRAKCWGYDGYGQLGIGTIVQRLLPGDLVEVAQPELHLNYTEGVPGSFFTVNGWNFPPNSATTIVANGHEIGTTPVGQTGEFVLFLGTADADAGLYSVAVNSTPSTAVSLFLKPNSPLRLQEGGGLTLDVPAGIAHPWHSLYLPLVLR